MKITNEDIETIEWALINIGSHVSNADLDKLTYLLRRMRAEYNSFFHCANCGHSQQVSATEFFDQTNHVVCEKCGRSFGVFRGKYVDISY